MAYMEDDNGRITCDDCWYFCDGDEPCEQQHCQCTCRTGEAARARELDDRPAGALASLARDLALEAQPSVEELQRERFGTIGYPTRGRA